LPLRENHKRPREEKAPLSSKTSPPKEVLRRRFKGLKRYQGPLKRGKLAPGKKWFKPFGNKCLPNLRFKKKCSPKFKKFLSGNLIGKQ